jgi:acetylornithine deacetylase/succinyl-diaminopimelate desuccinylase-like protein
VVSIDLDSISRPRPPGSKAHGEVRDILLQTMQHMDLMPYEGKVFLWSYHGQGSDTFANVLGVLPGRDASLPPMILGAHYDSVPAPPDKLSDVALYCIFSGPQQACANRLRALFQLQH